MLFVLVANFNAVNPAGPFILAVFHFAFSVYLWLSSTVHGCYLTYACKHICLKKENKVKQISSVLNAHSMQILSILVI